MTGTMNMRRRKLLTTVSVAALFAAIYTVDEASAADADRPPLWLELGWHYEGVAGSGDVFAPAFMSALAADGFKSPLSLQRISSYSYGGEGEISFQPDASSWTFSASVRYGRAHSYSNKHAQTAPASATQKFAVTRSGVLLFGFSQPVRPYAARFENAAAGNQETHAIVDFQAGKDVGLGIGRQGSSNLSVGVRFAQMHLHSATNISGDPDFAFKALHINHQYGSVGVHRTAYKEYFHRYTSEEQAERSFSGIGPSISWKSSAALAGNPQDGEIGLDWGLNAALLFGKQKTSVAHHVIGDYYSAGFGKFHLSHQATNLSPRRTRQVIVPDLGGTVGISYRFVDAKLSIGYRGDFFFGAFDGGIDTRKSTTRGFYGPFASISVGLGD